VRRHGEVKGQEWGVSEIWGSADRVQPAGEERLRRHAALVSQLIRRVARVDGVDVVILFVTSGELAIAVKITNLFEIKWSHEWRDEACTHKRMH
jgi:hypothetical protein